MWAFCLEDTAVSCHSMDDWSVPAFSNEIRADNVSSENKLDAIDPQ
jgi:hypothetical protein